MRPKTGEIVWHYQVAPNDVFDWDTVWEIILADIRVDGQMRKVAMQMNRNGFLYVLDRANGKLLSAKPFAKVNWATHVDMKTGRPVESEVSKKLRAGEQIEMWPSVAAPRTGRTPRSTRTPGCSMPTPTRAIRNTSSFPLSRIQAGPALPGHRKHLCRRSRRIRSADISRQSIR